MRSVCWYIQREILPYEPVREVSDEPYLCVRKTLMMERGDLCEVSQVAVDSPFGVVQSQ